MNTQECLAALQDCQPKMATVINPGLVIESELVIGDSLFGNLLETLKTFLKEYVELPPKEVVLEAFEMLVDTALVSLSIGTFTKRILKRALMITAESLYDMFANPATLA